MSYGAKIWSASKQEMVDALAPIYYLDYFLPSGSGSRSYNIESGMSIDYYMMETINGYLGSVSVSGNTINWTDARGTVYLLVFQK
ncbi:hypothetical protein FOD84_14665 [Salmonella enterica]|uniref:Uncharacterized protein n=1 Tax=Salmonella potsdam TaxID=597 RepID=A0A702BX85_SALPO|nr:MULTISPECIES: hypothetical protein [Enterobacteriaceae]EAM1121867.1 hypothetical protein [Salmonella enterica]EBR9914202.1 hypothetical protein [Salmonella enterica subsp. enterica serovar Virchow]EDC1951675.1 hypothetical protein [Salmonella enterica subsp. enterica serovar Newport]EDH7534919.1 hypothetical protein [Salmonella enterica subsp. enterica serovar Typhimurium]EDK1286077.1 hypothetical protein [Salmonella enterica subsp. enterica serovar Infantis]EDS8160595.1 hypothetical prote